MPASPRIGLSTLPRLTASQSHHSLQRESSTAKGGRGKEEEEGVDDELELTSLPPSSAPSSRTPSPSSPPSLPPTPSAEESSYPPRYSGSPSPSVRVVAALPPTDGGSQAWIFLLASFAVEGLVWGLPPSYAVFQDYYLAPDGPYPRDQGLVTLTGTLASGISYMAGIVLLPLVDRKPSWRRPFLWGGFLAMCAGLIGSAFVQSAGMLVLTQGVIYSIGGSVMYAPMLSYLHEWFIQRTGLAYGVLTAGTSIAGVVFPFILSASLRRFGSTGTLWGLGCFLFVLVGPLLLLVKARLPVSSRTSRMDRHEPSTLDYSFLRSKVFWILSLANLCQSFGHFMPSIFVTQYAALFKASDASAGALSLAMMNLSSAFSRIIFGVLVDANTRLTPFLSFISCLGSSISVLALWGLVAGTSPGLIAFSVVFGIFSGGYSTLYAGMIRQVGTDSPAQTATLYGVFAFVRGIGNVLAAPVSTALLQGGALDNYALGDFGKLVVFTGAMLFVGGLVPFAAGWKAKPSIRRD